MNWTAFEGERFLASGPAADVAITVRRAMDRNAGAVIQTFDDVTGRFVDFDIRRTDEEIAIQLDAAYSSPVETTQRGVGRPKLGVVAREVTLLPRHWEWLAEQTSSASATIRALIDEARKRDAGAPSASAAQAAADCFMMAKLGDQPGYEEASRALYARDEYRFMRITVSWPKDLRDHARKLAAPAFRKGEEK